eukprot:gene7524-biopygen15092
MKIRYPCSQVRNRGVHACPARHTNTTRPGPPPHAPKEPGRASRSASHSARAHRRRRARRRTSRWIQR